MQHMKIAALVQELKVRLDSETMRKLLDPSTKLTISLKVVRGVSLVEVSADYDTTDVRPSEIAKETPLTRQQWSEVFKAFRKTKAILPKRLRTVRRLVHKLRKFDGVDYRAVDNVSSYQSPINTVLREAGLNYRMITFPTDHSLGIFRIRELQ